jgi:hypothetical protein
LLALGGCPSDDKEPDDQGSGGAADAGPDAAPGDTGDAATPIGATDAGGTSDQDAATSNDSDASMTSADSGSGSANKPDEMGFDLEGVWCPQREKTAGCAAVSGRFFVNQGGTSADSTRVATAYVVFGGDAAPAPGEYKVNMADGATPPAAHEASIWFNDARDMSDYWYSDGKSGTVNVVAGSGKAIDVIWHDVTLVRGAGSITLEPGSMIESTEGWQTCMPK